jgi:Flp pilus assembly CpaE family ATPase
LLLVTTPEVPSLSTTRRFLDMLKQYPLLRDKPKLLVNRHPSKGGVELAEIERSLGLEVLATVPSDGFMITAAINEGLALAQKSATSVTVRNLSKLAELLVVPTDRPAVARASGATHRFSLNWRRNTTG